ncbi:MAG TPA: XrtA system polysaccharide deacetylase [Spongiibacteraceae bacterium]|nr:XrtA system polysaccharide deacetylase [Spongiibacteraceae bacterium]
MPTESPLPSPADSPSPVIRHAMTVDVEDYYHVSAFANVIAPRDWERWPSTVERNTQRLLDLFDETSIKATFFVLGWVAERHPQLVREIHARGHELASHGYSHQLVYKQTPALFREETAKSKQLLEDIAQTPIIGYRAASYSITRESLWAIDILIELGFHWDSSIFPVYHDRYGIPDSPTQPYRIRSDNGELLEFPLTTAKLLGYSMPAAGGGYFRLYPYALSRWLFKNATNDNRTPAIFYLHPWEIDELQPRVPGASLLSRFRHYNNLAHCLPRLKKMLAEFPFGTVSDSLRCMELQAIDRVQLAP